MKKKWQKKRENEASLLLNKLYCSEKVSKYHVPYPEQIIAIHDFNEPNPIISEVNLLTITVMDLLIQYAYPSISSYCKFTLQFRVKQLHHDFDFTLGSAIALTFDDGVFIPKNQIYDQVYSLISQYIEKYDCECIVRITLRIYILGCVNKEKISLLSKDDRESFLLECLKPVSDEMEPIIPKKLQHKSQKRHYCKYITAIKSSKKKIRLNSFLVADTETILIDNVHKVYAAGVMRVIPGHDLKKTKIDTFFSEDYSPNVWSSFEERSENLLNDFYQRIFTITKQNPEVKTVYLHNFGRFDGIFLLKHLVVHHELFKLKPLFRDNRLYEVAVYSNRKMLFRLRDSLHLLTGSLSSLAMNLCPELGSKGSIEYDQVNVENLSSQRDSLLDYMKQDILLLGGIMQKFQDIYAKEYNSDITNKITIASLALSLFRSNYYNEEEFPIHIPNKNVDTFIRSGYYGGHADAYIPIGENLYYYDVNSLYPFVMQEFPMPGGEPKWSSDLESMELDNIYGFIKAYVECPKTIKRPFLPYRDEKDGTLIFPTGEFIGVYYSEELKYARDLGYKVIPISGYLFEKMESPFKGYVNSLFESRSKAKKDGHHAISYVYKLLLNSLYGRFGINPITTVTELCDKHRRELLMRKVTFLNETLLRKDLYMVSYQSNMEKGPDSWKAPTNSAIQIPTAITSSARIYMHPYISRDDCYYTDTDSIIIGNPLPEEMISSTEIGKFKLEDLIFKGYFLAPKAYTYFIKEKDTQVLKYKGGAKSLIDFYWFKQQHADPFRVTQGTVNTFFKINWRNLEIGKNTTTYNLALSMNKKRKLNIIDKNWIDTEPINIIQISDLNHIGKKIVKALRNQIKDLENDKTHLLNERLTLIQDKIEQSILHQPSLYNTKSEAKKARKAKKRNVDSSPQLPKPDE